MKRLYKYVFIILLILLLVTFLCYYRGVDSRKLLKKYVPVNFVIPSAIDNYFGSNGSSSSSSWFSENNVSDSNWPPSLSPTSLTTSTALHVSTSFDKSIEQTCEEVIPVSTSSHSPKRYVMALSFWEQLTMATTSLCALTVFSRVWKAKTVAPFTRSAEFWGLPSTKNYPWFHGMPPIYSAGPTRPLDSLFNMTQFNFKLLCNKYKISPLSSFEDFLINADRGITLLHFNFNSFGSEKPDRTFFKYKDHVDCMSIFGGYSSKLLSVLNAETTKRGLPSFYIHSACCVNHSRVTTPQELADKCGLLREGNFTIINTVWRGFSGLITKKFRLIVPESSLPILRHPSPSTDAFPLNDNIQRDSLNYYKNFTNGGNDFLAVHIRTAKIAMLNYRSRKRLSTKCFSLMWKLISQVQQEYTHLPVKYFVDYGPYGSHSFEVSLGKKISKRPFQERKIVPLHYDPVRYSGWADQGYVALVEQNTIAMARVLVLVGGGSFQEQILAHFMLIKKGGIAYKACWTKEALDPQMIERH